MTFIMSSASEKINFTALTKEQLVLLLRKVGSTHFSLTTLDVDIAAGVPVNQDGTVNLVYYCAWLVREIARD